MSITHIYHHSSMHVILFIVHCGLCMYSTVGLHPHPLCNLCAKFCFFCSLQCWASPWTKTAYSINQSLADLVTHPAYLREPKLSLHKTETKWHHRQEPNYVAFHWDPFALFTCSNSPHFRNYQLNCSNSPHFSITSSIVINNEQIAL